MKSYKVRLVPPNLRKNETIIQIADSLDLLSRVFDDITIRIEKRIDTYVDNLNNVSERVKIVENKIEKLKQVKNAIQVFSSSKYPAADTQKGFKSIFPTNSEIHLMRHEVSQKYPLKKDEPFDKLHIYHVKLRKTETENTEGLGQIPNDVNFISDLMLFNSGRNPYRNFSASKPLQFSISPVKAENNKVYIGSAPASIAERSFSNLPNQEYFYSPDLGDVPSLDIPLDLPDLPGVASNVRYQEDNNFVIAPSVALPTILTNIPVDITLDENLEELPEIILTQTSFHEIEELPMGIPIDEVEVDEKKPESVKQELPSEINIQENRGVKEAPKLPSVPDSRASLMEAIREAGGRKVLKSVDDKPTSTKNEVSGGDLMADLHAKLAMRRKGISGAKKNIENSEIDSRGALSLMSALIPAPEESNEETDHEEDWE